MRLTITGTSPNLRRGDTSGSLRESTVSGRAQVFNDINMTRLTCTRSTSPNALWLHRNGGILIHVPSKGGLCPLHPICAQYPPPPEHLQARAVCANGLGGRITIPRRTVRLLNFMFESLPT